LKQMLAEKSGAKLSTQSQTVKYENEQLKQMLAEKSGAKLSTQSQALRDDNAKLQSEIAERQQQLEHQQQQSSKKDPMDVCFLMDCTGSMEPWLDVTRQKISAVVAEIQKTFHDTDLRLAFVGYRDFDDKPQFEILNFQMNIDTFEQFVGNVKANGGGDVPEDVFGGFEKVLSLIWESSVRVLIHFADAPCHGSVYHSVSDNNPDFDDGKKGKQYMKTFIDKRIHYYFGEINREQTITMTTLFKKWYDKNETKQMPMTILPLDGSVEKSFFDQVVLAISTSGKLHLKLKS